MPVIPKSQINTLFETLENDEYLKEFVGVRNVGGTEFPNIWHGSLLSQEDSYIFLCDKSGIIRERTEQKCITSSSFSFYLTFVGAKCLNEEEMLDISSAISCYLESDFRIQLTGITSILLNDQTKRYQFTLKYIYNF